MGSDEGACEKATVWALAVSRQVCEESGSGPRAHQAERAKVTLYACVSWMLHHLQDKDCFLPPMNTFSFRVVRFRVSKRRCASSLGTCFPVHSRRISARALRCVLTQGSALMSAINTNPFDCTCERARGSAKPGERFSSDKWLLFNLSERKLSDSLL